MEKQLLLIKQNYGKYILPLIVVCIAFVCYFPSLSNDFVNWDDPDFVQKNETIRELSIQSITNLFTTLEQEGGYTPLTFLSFAVNYQLAELNPFSFHLTNLLLHLFNVFLVFIFVLKLFKRNDIALFCTLLFGLHPMNVEAVAWITARKDVLYSFFFLLSLISYYNFTIQINKKWKWYGLSLLFFLLSILSKGMAITLPALLVLIDYLKKRQDIKKVIFEKIPFLVITAIFLVIGVLGQQKEGALQDLSSINLFEGIFIAAHNYIFFIVKAVAPFGLSPYHPYPPGVEIPWYFYAAIVPVLAIFYATIKLFRKNRLFVFGLLFFAVAIIPVVQFLPFGAALLGERYAYIPYIGLYILLGYGGLQFIQKITPVFPRIKHIALILLGGLVFLFGSITFQQTQLWKNGTVLWTNVIENYPYNKVAYSNRSECWRINGDLQKAIQDMEMAIKCDSNFYVGYNLLGFIYLKINKNQLALTYINQSLKINPVYGGAYVNRAIAYANLGKKELALADLNWIISNDKNHIPVYYFNRGICLLEMNQYQKAVADFNKATELGYNKPMLHREKGRALILLNKQAEALYSLNKALEQNDHDKETLYLRGTLYMNQQKYEQALIDLSNVISIDKQYIKAHLNRGVAYMNLKKYEAANTDFLNCEKLNPGWPLIYLNRGVLFLNMEYYQEAIQQFSYGIEKQPKNGTFYIQRANTYHKMNAIDLEKKDLKIAQQLGISMTTKQLERLN